MASAFRSKARLSSLALALSAFFFLPLSGAAQTAPANPTVSATPSPTATAAPSPVDPSPEAFKHMSLEDLMNLDVTSVAKAPEPWGRAPAAIDLITHDEILRSGARTIPEALRLADNLEVAQVNSSNWDISARGFNSSVGNKLLVLIDGRSVYTPLFAGVIWNMQNVMLEDVDRIEVISGPGGTLWGANAVNGVINIKTKSAKDTQGLYWSASGGSDFQDSVNIRYGGRLDRDAYYRIYGFYFDEGPEQFADGASAEDNWSRAQGGFRIDAGDKSKDLLTAQGDIYQGQTGVLPGGEGATFVQGNASGGNLLGRWTHNYSGDDQMILQTYYDRACMAAPFQGAPAYPAFPPFYPASPAIPAGTLWDTLDTLDFDFQHRFPLLDWDRMEWGLGYRYTHDHVVNAPVVAFEPNDLDRNLFSGFLQDEMRLLPGFSITLGSKLEHNDYTGWEYEPSGRFQWGLEKGQMLWGAVSRAVRTPSRYDRDLDQPGPDHPYIFHLVSNDSFVSEDVVSYELGYRAQLDPKVSGSLSTFFNNYTNLRSEPASVVLGNPQELIQLTFQNGLAAQAWGAELSTDYQALEGWRLHLGYDLLQEKVWIVSPEGDNNNALNETADPQNQVFLRSSMDLPGRLSLDGAFRWIDTVYVNNGSTPASVPAYAELDARLAWQATDAIELSITGQNLLQDRHAEAGFPGPAQEEIVRSVYGKVDIRL